MTWMVIGKSAPAQFDFRGFCFTRVKTELRKTFQLLDRANHRALQWTNVELYNFLPCHFACVGDVNADSEDVIRLDCLLTQFGLAIAKNGVAEPVTEGELHRHFFGIVVAIANKQALTVAHRAFFPWPVEISWGIFNLDRVSFSQLSAGVEASKQNICQRRGPSLAEHPRLQDGWHCINPFAHDHRRTAVDDHHGLGLRFGNGFDQGDLVRGQVEVRAVIAFRLIPLG